MRSRLFVSLLLLLFAAAPAMAHPLPDFRYDRIIDIRLHPRKVEVRYTLMLSFGTITADNRKLFTPQEIEQMGGDIREATKRYCKKMAPILAEKLEAKIGNKRLKFHAVKLELQPDGDHGKFRYVFEAPWVVNGGGAENTFTFEDHNFEDACGAIWLVTRIEKGKGLEEEDILDPPTKLRGKAPSELKPGEAELTRKMSAVFTAPSLPPLPPEITTQAKNPEPPAATQRETEPQVVVVENKPEEDLPPLFPSHEFKTPFDTNYGPGVLLLLAAVIGAFHAFAPGHSKSAAAFLVSETGSVRRAILLGLSTTFAHTGSIILIAGILYLRYQDIIPQDAQNRLIFIGGGGLLVFFVAMWLFMSRLRGQVDHAHLFGGCSDMCGNSATAPNAPQCRVPLRDGAPVDQPLQREVVPQRSPMSWFRVVLLGIGAGAIPCVDAVLLLTLAVSAGKFAFTLPLLVSFSIGLSVVLSLVILLHRAGNRGFRERVWFRLLPTASAVLLMGMGLWMARVALQGLIAAG